MRWDDKALVRSIMWDLAMAATMTAVVIASAWVTVQVMAYMHDSGYSPSAMGLCAMVTFFVLVFVAYEIVRRLFGDRLSRSSWPM